MKVSDIQHGDATVAEVRPKSDEDFGTPIAPLSEVNLFFQEMTGTTTLKIGDRAWDIEGCDARQQALLKNMTMRNLPTLSWVVAAAPNQSGEPTRTLVLEVREFPTEYVWPEAVQLGVDEKVVDAVRQKRKALVSTDDVVAWLTSTVLIGDVGHNNNRVLLSGSPTPHAENRGEFRVYGKGVAVDIARDAEDRLMITRIVEAHRPQQNDERRPVIVAHGQFEFVDYTIAGCFRGTARSQIDQLVKDSNSYLGLWREYNKLERKIILQRAREFEWLRYAARRQLANGRWRFNLADAVTLNAKICSLEDEQKFDLEAAESPPAELTGSNSDDRQKSESRRSGVFAGKVVGIDRQKGTLDLRLPHGRGKDEGPPEKGVLFMSLSGDRKRLERREKAQSIIAAAESPMPQLGLILEGSPVPERRRKFEDPLSPAAREAFGGEPTERQIEALRVALNTPDIALIQGPPGTGKTRTIAALEARLSEIAEAGGSFAGRSLLTSYQHDAVETVAAATQVFGLPAIKVGRKRGQTEEADGFDRWRRDRIDAVRAQLSNIEEQPAAEALRQCRDLAVAYLKAPSRSDDASILIDKMRALASRHIPAKLDDDLLELKDRLRCSAVSSVRGLEDSELALKAVRGLRVDEIAFADDGALQAGKVLRRLERSDVLNNQARDLLARAADWDSEAVPDFLSDLQILQDILVDRLSRHERPAGSPLVNSDIEATFGKVISALHHRVRSTRGGVDAVLYEYLDDLENAPNDAREAVKQYTTVLAATCQQADGKEMADHKKDGIAFETVVVDEAARANPLDLLIPMSLAERRIILVGDHRQLPHMLEPEIEREMDKGVSEEAQDKLRQSLFERLFNQLRERENADGIKRTVTLDVQYRMHPELGQFISDTFYAPHGETFKSSRDASEFKHGLSRYGNAVAAWVDIPLRLGNEHGAQSKFRTAEAKWIAEETLRILNERTDFSVGVITFYSAQVTEILQQMEGQGLTKRLDDGSFEIAEAWRETRGQTGRLKERLRVGTVDAFQGKEFDVAILSMTRANDMGCADENALRRKFGHLRLENRLCVAMSRQQRLLVVVGDSAMVKGERSADAIPGLVRFYELCGGTHGVQIHA